MRDQRGQAALEYVGALVLVALVIAVVVTVVGKVPLVGPVSQAVADVFDGHAASGHGGRGAAGTTTPGSTTPAPGATGTTPASTGTTPGATVTTPAPATPPTAAGAGATNRGPQSDRLPSDGQRPYVPPKKAHGKPQRVRGGGFEDANGNVWKWDPSGHAGPHWDVEHPDGSHTNVSPEGQVIGGRDNFPNKAPSGSGSDSGGDGGSDTVKKAAGGAAIVGGTGAAIWWGLKILSPACGPAAPLCAIFG
jgi:Flp pilus assembly pilin Flp